MTSRAVIPVILALVGLNAGCGQLNQHAGSRDGAARDTGLWGHLVGPTDQWLAQLGPEQTVSVCGNLASHVEAAIRDWGAGLGRLDLKVDATCNRQADRVVVISDITKAAVKRECDRQPNVAGLAIVELGVIMVCVDGMDASPVILHEVGHLWGLCDVYPLPEGIADNCDPRHFHGTRARTTVMGANYGAYLGDGDVTGARNLSERGDITGNALWPKDEPAATSTATFAAALRPARGPVKINKDMLSDVIRVEDVGDDLLAELLSEKAP